MTKKKFEDSFVKISGLIGGEDYVKVAKSLLSHENTTDEEIAESTELKININALYKINNQWYNNY